MIKKTIILTILIFSLVFFSGFLRLPFQCGGIRDAGVFKSSDAGEVWQHKVTIDKRHSIAAVNVLSLTIDPNNSETVYLGARENGIYKSTDGAETWQKIADKNDVLRSRANIYQIAVDPKNSNNIYAAGYQENQGRLFKSQNGGESWEEVYVVSQEKYAVFSVAIDPFESQTVYMGTAQGGFLQSMDYGESWRTVGWFDGVINNIVINPRDTRIIYLGTFQKGVYRTTDRGISWQNLEGVKVFKGAEKVESLVIDPNNPNILYLGSSYGLLRTTNSGQSWEGVNIIIPTESLPILSVAVHPSNSQVIYFGAGPSIYKTTDGGGHWSIKRLDTSKKVKAIVIDPKFPNNVYLGIHK